MSPGPRRFAHSGRSIDMDDPRTWAIRPGIDSTSDTTSVVLTDQQCSAIAAILDRARASRVAHVRRAGAAA